MSPTAISQLIEALGKLFLGVFFAKLALNAGYGLPIASAWAIAGLGVGTLLSSLYLLILKLADDRKNKDTSSVSHEEYKEKNTFLTLFKIAVPITLSSAVLSVTRIIDMTLIMRRLQDIGYSTAGANAVYGSYTTLALPVFSLVPSLITPVALALVPRLSAAIERRSSDGQSEVAESSLRITTFFAIPASMGVAVYSRQILELLFPKESEAIAVASPLLALLGISILFACLITTTNAVLQSYRQTVKPIISMGVGALVKVVSAYILIGMPSVGVYGAPISTLLCNLTVTAINLYFMNKHVPRICGVFKVYIKPFAVSCVMIVLSFAVYLSITYYLENTVIAFVVAMLAALIAYFAFSLLFGAVSEEDINMLPMGAKISLIIKKLGFKIS